MTTTVDLSWTEVSGATKYVLRTWWNGADDWQAIGDGSLTGTSFAHTDLTPGRTYLYIVAGLDGNDERGAWSEQVSVTIPDSDAQPTASGLSVPTVNAIGGADRITLRWGAVANADSYRLIVWDAATEDWSSIGGVLTDTSYTHSELTDGTTNHYYVRAVGAAEALGAWSKLASATVSAAGTTTPSPTPATTERGALVALYEATDGANWVENENWLTDEPLATWNGVVTDSSGSVTELDLSANGLRGTIPNLSALSDLSVLDLGQNALTGPIPDLSAHTELTRLDLGLNDLSGSIPDPSALTNLTILNLGANQLTGPLPELNVLTNLTTLDLEGNGLTGEITGLSALSKLIHLYLGHNRLTGEIPDPGALSNLKTLVLSHNLLTGPIPDLDALTGLIRLDLHSNQLAGEIPDLGDLTELTWLDLHSNQLTGAIPDRGDSRCERPHLPVEAVAPFQPTERHHPRPESRRGADVADRQRQPVVRASHGFGRARQTEVAGPYRQPVLPAFRRRPDQPGSIRNGAREQPRSFCLHGNRTVGDASGAARVDSERG